MRTKQIIAMLPVKSVAILIGIVLAVVMNAGIASAGVYFSICNDGSLSILLVVKDNYSSFFSNPTVSGWYQVDPGKCYGKNGQIDITVGFYTKGTKVSSYYDFDPPKVTSGWPNWVPDLSSVIERSTRSVCVDIEKSFERQGSQKELEQCPAGWESRPLGWHIWLDPDEEDRSLTLHVTPTLDKIRSLAPSALPHVDPVPEITDYGWFPSIDESEAGAVQYAHGPWIVKDGGQPLDQKFNDIVGKPAFTVPMANSEAERQRLDQAISVLKTISACKGAQQPSIIKIQHGVMEYTLTWDKSGPVLYNEKVFIQKLNPDDIDSLPAADGCVNVLVKCRESRSCVFLDVRDSEKRLVASVFSNIGFRVDESVNIDVLKDSLKYIITHTATLDQITKNPDLARHWGDLH
jgi:hypothetical protein